jgi:hypothetical protein
MRRFRPTNFMAAGPCADRASIFIGCVMNVNQNRDLARSKAENLPLL